MAHVIVVERGPLAVILGKDHRGREEIEPGHDKGGKEGAVGYAHIEQASPGADPCRRYVEQHHDGEHGGQAPYGDLVPGAQQVAQRTDHHRHCQPENQAEQRKEELERAQIAPRPQSM